MKNERGTPDKAQWVYDAPNFNELADRYDQWAEDYDRDMKDVFGNVGPQKMVEIVTQYVSTDAKILDAGAGTGLVGELLSQRGYKDLEALDISAKMLAEAREKNVYNHLHQEILGEQLKISSDYYDAVVVKGVFAPNHASVDAFDELIRITKPRGYIIFTIRSDYYESSDFQKKLPALEVSEHWQLVEMTDKFACWPKASLNIFYNIWVYRIN
ncbi:MULTISPECIES: class I SAM-dependent methyltransferase [Spirulina sp. CCY15215]|uniref:class I SAM-dependent DNA methyltransferase n=1 Tax=Spirulina sp. CCY15215 TaxID=2767591 RepID=UPI00194FE0D8|nr:class I SAM-dependent methyltransferase [Spirulina major]